MYEFVSHYHTDDTELEGRLKTEFDRVADAPNAAQATYSLLHEDGGHQTFTAKFASLVDARAFREAVAADPDADSQVEPRLEDLEAQPPERIEPTWSEPPSEAS